MESASNRQLELGLDARERRSESGYTQWLEQRRAALRELGKKLGLPIGHSVEIWLNNGIRLRGVLRLREETLLVPEERDPKLELTVGGVCFKAEEIDGCVRQD